MLDAKSKLSLGTRRIDNAGWGFVQSYPSRWLRIYMHRISSMWL